MDTQRVINEYQNCKSIKKIAANLNMSEVKVRRILITAGLWSSKTSDAVKELLDQNLTVAEIAQKLCMSEKNVQAYMPYKKGTYHAEELSVSAIRCQLYRERCQNAAANQVSYSPTSNNKKARLTTIRRKQAQTVHLQLALNTSGLNDQESVILSKYGKAASGITRDVLVPSTITLHALHYLIQNAFGWQNSHLHHFALPDSAFAAWTDESFRMWCELCGVLFRFPELPIDDLYWDNDYDGSASIRGWFIQKYYGPYRYAGNCERYPDSQKFLKNFLEHFPALSEPGSDDNIDSVTRNTRFGDPNTLLERLTIGDLMLPDGSSAIEHMAEDLVSYDPITQSIKYYYDYGDSWEVTISIIADSPDAEDHPEVAALEEPICIAADGLDLLENIGGVPGYCKFLAALHGEKPRVKSEAQELARSYGWTGKNRNIARII